MRVQIVSFNCVLKNKLGHFISSSFNQDVVTTQMRETPDTMLPGLARALGVLKKGQKRAISLSADEAYGFYDPKLVFSVARSRVPVEKIRIGDIIHIDREDEGLVPCRVLSQTKGSVTLDANHPLAGQDLIFNVEVTASHSENDPTFDSAHESKMLC
jgi:FKBP-type peptidyl-prolyl cis-trans isomerase SlyD